MFWIISRRRLIKHVETYLYKKVLMATPEETFDAAEAYWFWIGLHEE